MWEVILDISQSAPENNPLACPQRENAGALTFEKFEYQYHWALCRILEAHEVSKDYVIFMELHEDVLFATSTDITNAEFEFTQVKSISSSPCTATQLVKLQGSNKSNSLLGKMLSGIKDKPFISRLKNVDLVLTCGYKIDLKKEKKSYKLNIITINDIDENCLQKIQDAINRELGDYPLPQSLRFVIPELPSISFQDTTKGKIINLIDKFYPNSKCSPLTIYRAIIDDLHRKGTNQNNYLNWEKMIKTQGITYSQVQEIILVNTDYNKESFIQTFNELIPELGLNRLEKISIRFDFDRYMNTIHIGRSLDTVNNKNEIVKVIDNNFQIFENHSFKDFIEATLNDLPQTIKNNFTDRTELLAAITYELINKIYEERTYNR
ncbi:hypothetical protein BHC48_06985 [Snodgrassella communis]|uniref:CD-NTase associated protein 4-like DNA endonuclease domain-containing protein n=1 Tax=Snodgrassella alvi TaxID=1196083 RepID=A0A2N9XQ32_9NEIS|nr:hypothetical protein BHC48_06985 [Snodgrassella communis]